MPCPFIFIRHYCRSHLQHASKLIVAKFIAYYLACMAEHLLRLLHFLRSQNSPNAAVSNRRCHCLGTIEPFKNFSQFYCNIHKRCSSSSMVLSTIYIAVISSVTQVLPPMCVLAWSIACYSQDLHAARTNRFTDRFGQKFPLSLAMSVCESCELRSRMCGCRMRSIT